MNNENTTRDKSAYQNYLRFNIDPDPDTEDEFYASRQEPNEREEAELARMNHEQMQRENDECERQRELEEADREAAFDDGISGYDHNEEGAGY